MERIIQDDGASKAFNVSVLLYQGFPYVDGVFNKKFTIKYQNMDLKLFIKRHIVSFNHIPQFELKTTKTHYQLPLIEFLISSIPLDYPFLMKKLKRYKSQLNEDSLARYPHWESIALSTVLRKLSIEVINQFIDYYRLFTLSVSIPPISEGSILYIAYQTSNANGLYTIEDTKLGSRKFQAIDEEQSDLAEGLQYFIASLDRGSQFLINIINSVRLFETGYYNECIVSIINAFHYFLDIFIDKHIQVESLKAAINKSPAEFDTTDKTTWMFEMITGKTLQGFLKGIDNEELYDKYSKYRTLRNEIVHPKLEKENIVSFGDAYTACLTIMMIIRFIRTQIEKDKDYSDLLSRLDTYVSFMTEHT